MTPIVTARLKLRSWKADDALPFAAMNRDPRVMEFYPSVLNREETDALIDRIAQHFALHGFGPCAVELRATGEFIGYVGLFIPQFEAAFTPCVEIGWRIAAEHWEKGLATEAAQAVLHDGFERLFLPEIVSFTVPDNVRSRRVMAKLGMTHDPAENFDHPLLSAGHPLRRHVLYRLRRPALP